MGSLVGFIYFFLHSAIFIKNIFPHPTRISVVLVCIHTAAAATYEKKKKLSISKKKYDSIEFIYSKRNSIGTVTCFSYDPARLRMQIIVYVCSKTTAYIYGTFEHIHVCKKNLLFLSRICVADLAHTTPTLRYIFLGVSSTEVGDHS